MRKALFYVLLLGFLAGLVVSLHWGFPPNLDVVAVLTMIVIAIVDRYVSYELHGDCWRQPPTVTAIVAGSVAAAGLLAAFPLVGIVWIITYGSFGYLYLSWRHKQLEV